MGGPAGVVIVLREFLGPLPGPALPCVHLWGCTAPLLAGMASALGTVEIHRSPNPQVVICAVVPVPPHVPAEHLPLRQPCAHLPASRQAAWMLHELGHASAWAFSARVLTSPFRAPEGVNLAPCM